MNKAEIKRVSIDLSEDEVRYILHSLNEFKTQCHQKIDEDEDSDLAPMLADDVMQARLIHEKILKTSTPVFGEGISNPISYETL